MGISEGLSEGEEVDCSPGTIVWVRRRNGSWWPGRVLGPEELSASHLMSPRSGTPVKLLGREDASIDWYNLEKSKRVKAFRCGEFDDCIERAESSQGIPIKKREKYARREDAIIHALELEKQQLEKRRQELGITTNCTSEKMDSSVTRRGENEATDLHKYAHHKSHLNSKMSEPSLEEETMGNQLYAQTDKPMRQPSWEDDHSEAVPRMRGLQDFGLRIAPSKKNYNHVPPNHVGSSKSPLATKMRSLSGPTEESFVKRRDRRRPLVQVLQSSRKLPPHHSFPPNSNVMSRSMHGEREHVGVICRAKRSKCVYLPAESDDCLNQAEFPSDQMQISGPLVEEDTCSESSDESDGDVAEETAVPPLDSPRMLMVGGPSNVGKGTGKRQTMQLDEPLHSNQMSHLLSHEHYADISADMGGSKWQLKGKRNIRNLTKRPLEAVDDRQAIIIAERCNGSTPQVFHDGKGNLTPTASQGNPEQGVYNKGDAPTYVDDEGDLVEKNLRHTQMVGYGNRRYPFMLKSTSGDQGLRNHDITDSDEDSIADRRGYWEEADVAFNSIYVGHLGNGMDSMLVDVDLKVQASYQGERVPLVSLMSRLNGTAIIGHPIPIEKLEDGSSDLLLYTNDSGDELSDHNDVNTGLPPVWRTARRTAMHRPPRPHPSSAMEGEEADPFLPSDYGGKPPYVGHLNHKARLMKRSYSHHHSPLRERKFSNKLLKKVSLSNQKTRRLSSIAIEQRFSRCKPGKRDEGLIKPDELAPAIACVPVKLVFSRILEGVGRTPLKGERKPS